MDKSLKDKLIDWAIKYNDPVYFQEDPIIFPKEFLKRGADLRDIETAAVFAAHFAWGRRAMIVRDLQRLFDHMEWKPFEYVRSRDWRDDGESIHRTIKWSETARICERLERLYRETDTLEGLPTDRIRTEVYGQKSDPKAANKKINMMRRWLVRKDGIVDLGVWKNSSPADLVMPLDVHVCRQANELGLTKSHTHCLGTAIEITEVFREIFPDDPVRGDFALFGYGVTHS